MSHIVMKDEALDPTHIRPLRRQRSMPHAKLSPKLIEKPGSPGSAIRLAPRRRDWIGSNVRSFRLFSLPSSSVSPFSVLNHHTKSTRWMQYPRCVNQSSHRARDTVPTKTRPPRYRTMRLRVGIGRQLRNRHRPKPPTEAPRECKIDSRGDLIQYSMARSRNEAGD